MHYDIIINLEPLFSGPAPKQIQEISITTQAHDIIWLFTVLGKLKMKSSYTNSIFFPKQKFKHAIRHVLLYVLVRYSWTESRYRGLLYEIIWEYRFEQQQTLDLIPYWSSTPTFLIFLLVFQDYRYNTLLLSFLLRSTLVLNYFANLIVAAVDLLKDSTSAPTMKSTGGHIQQLW